jgi:sirohydrochlorin cobaltochelatase
MTTSRGVVLLAHGSRDQRWHHPLESVRDRIVALEPHTPVLCAYMEMCGPDLIAAVDSLLAAKVTSITVVPMFIGTGKHVRDDLAQLTANVRQRYPTVPFDFQPAIGEDPRFTQLAAEVALARR